MITLSDGQTDRILDDIRENHIIENNHFQSLPENIETFNFLTFGDKPYTEHLTKRNRIIIPSEDNRFIEFIINEVEKYREGRLLYTEVYADASYLELKKMNIIEPQTFSSYTTSPLISVALNGTEWRAGTIEGEGLTRTITIENHTNAYDFLKRIANEFNLELHFRIETNGNRITGRYVDLLERVGDWRGREVEFGEDLEGITRIENNENIYTALIGLGPEDTEGNRMEVFIEDEQALRRWGRTDRNGNLKHLVGVYEPISENYNMTRNELIQYTRTELDKRINSVVEYRARIVDLENIQGLEDKKIRIGDTIRIKDTKFNPPLYLQARVHTQERNIKENERKTVQLGDYQEFTEEEINSIWKDLQFQMNLKLDLSDLLEVTYDKNTIDNKDGQAEQNAINFTEQYAEKKRVESISPPQDTSVVWIDTSNPENVIWKVFVNGEWIAGPSGPQGPRGLQGLEGPRGEQGLRGPKGDDGLSSFTHIAYANSSDGYLDFSTSDSTNKLYIGMYVDHNETDSNNPSDYKWTLIKGAKGEEGIQGPAGEDGRSPFLHIAYANSPDGYSGFSTTDSQNKLYIGQYTDFIQADSNNPDMYDWTLIKGEKGERGETGPEGPRGPQGEQGLRGLQGEKGDQGIQGPKGEDGTPSYTHIAYAMNSTGTSGFSTSDSTNKTYIGMYVDSNPTDSTDPSKYRWTKVLGPEGDRGPQGNTGPQGPEGPRGPQGSQGIPGPTGEDGRTPYFHVAYANNSSGTSGFSTWDSNGKLYIGQYTDFTQADSTDPNKYKWTKIKGEQGPQGSQGPRGYTGPEGDRGPQGPEGPRGPRGPQGPNIVDSTTEIEANVIKSNHIQVANLSSITADLGTIRTGTLRTVHLEGATGTFSGSISSPMLTVGSDNIKGWDTFGLRLQTAMWNADVNNPFIPTGYVNFNTLNNALEIYKENEDGSNEFLDGFLVSARQSEFLGRLVIFSDEKESMEFHRDGYTDVASIHRGYGGFGIAIDGSTKFHILPDGHVGIGWGNLSSYAPMLSVNGSGRFNGPLEVNGPIEQDWITVGNADNDLVGKSVTFRVIAENGHLTVRGKERVYIQPGWEARVVAPGSASSYVTIRAGNFLESSSIHTKTNIEKLTDEKALYLLKQADIFEYHRKNEVEKGIYDKKKIGMITEMTPKELVDEDSISLYSIASVLWKNAKIQHEKDEIKEQKINDLTEIVEVLSNEIDELKGVLQ